MCAGQTQVLVGVLSDAGDRATTRKWADAGWPALCVEHALPFDVSVNSPQIFDELKTFGEALSILVAREMNEPLATTQERQPGEMFRDPRFQRIVKMFVVELKRGGHTEAAAYDLVLDALGSAKTIRSIIDALDRVGREGSHEGLILVILRCRVIDLWRKQSRAKRFQTVHLDTEALDAALQRLVGLEARTEIELARGQARQQIRRIFDMFCDVEPHHGVALRRYVMEGRRYKVLTEEWGCTEIAARGRVHRAHKALRAYIRRHHPMLRELWDSLMESL